MEALSTFIKLYVLSLIVILIPSSNTSNSHTSNEATLNTLVDSFHFSTINNFDNFQPIESNTVIELEDNANEIINLAFNEIKNLENEVEILEAKVDYFQLPIKTNIIQPTPQFKSDFWTTLYSIESKQGRLMYRPSNKHKNCATTAGPCGHHQLSLQALQDIACTTKQCMKDRENYEKSLAMTKKLQAINNRRLKKFGYNNLPDYQKYLIHQQGAAGLKIILSASQGKKTLSKTIKKNMAGNSPYSVKKLDQLGSKLAAKKFLNHWNKKWKREKKLVLALNKSHKNKSSVIKPITKLNLPVFNNYELQIALNLDL